MMTQGVLFDSYAIASNYNRFNYGDVFDSAKAVHATDGKEPVKVELQNLVSAESSKKQILMNDSVPEQILDSTARNTLSHLDSLKALFDRERGISSKPRATQWNDSIAAAEDSIKKTQRKNVLDEPVEYSASDSIVFL